MASFGNYLKQTSRLRVAYVPGTHVAICLVRSVLRRVFVADGYSPTCGRSRGRGAGIREFFSCGGYPSTRLTGAVKFKVQPRGRNLRDDERHPEGFQGETT